VSDEVRGVVNGDGYAVGSIDAMGEGYGFRKVRRELGITAFGVNAIVIPPGYGGGKHFHDEQEETYFVHRGRFEFEFGDGRKFVLGPGGMARVDPATVRTLRNVGDDDGVYICFGGKDGYVGRDGRAVDGSRTSGPPGAA
jgi:mannose-6-phosphate isomerase-like protein (cupin superfamily)